MKSLNGLFFISILIFTFSCKVEVPSEDEGEFRSDDIESKSYLDDRQSSEYKILGIGGGGAMSGISISPYSSLWFVGTDMGTLFRSVDFGKTWDAVYHLETVFSPDIDHAVSVGFSSNPDVLFHAPGGQFPVRSVDGGKSWDRINIGLDDDEYIRYWRGDSYNENLMISGTTKGMIISRDQGQNWTRISDFYTDSLGTYIDYTTKSDHVIYHAVADGIYKSIDSGESFSKFYTPTNGLSIRKFTAGRDSSGLTLSFIDDNGIDACSWAFDFESEEGADRVEETIKHCGFLWVGNYDGTFSQTNQVGGDHIKMAENDSKTIFTTGSRYWIRQYGTKVWKSVNRGSNFDLKLHQYNWDVTPYAAWPEEKIEYSAPAIEQGWWDDGYESFEINLRNSSTVAGSGQFFLHVSRDGGDYWSAPFTEYADVGEKVKGKKWKSIGLEVTTVYNFSFHPANPKLGYAAMADIGGMVTEDGGKTFRISQALYNSNYDYAFPANDENIAFAVSGSSHDYPEGWHSWPHKGSGGVFKTEDKGHSWIRVTPLDDDFNRQFLTIAYDQNEDRIYAGSHGDGVIYSPDAGKTWSYINSGLPSGVKVIPQIEVDPENGNVYALVTGDAPEFSNREETGLYILEVDSGSTSWRLLRGVVHHPQEVEEQYKLWYYPTAFAVDFSEGSDRQTIWLGDYENNKNWLATGIWKTEDGGENWYRHIQYTHPTSIVMDPNDSNSIYLNGRWQIEGTWGDGGLIYTRDGGETWKKNLSVPLQHNGYHTTLDPSDPSKIFYTFFGNGLMYGPKPE
ncbi:WD40/YVTN/BNR-like repeat-containing protein [Halobacteriovorax sp.]|uniref:WD40/YVTN/BNR-like repeat-containing protein n=1 Tax=Halobacteriovorax sp. TaxID=2020862 RepID=UPI0035633D60